MNNEEYMEYEGYRIIEAALLSYTSPDRSLLPEAGPESGLVWDYVLFRLYLAEKTIRRFPSGFGCMDRMADGLRDGISHLSLTLHALSLLKNLEGSSLILLCRDRCQVEISINFPHPPKQYAPVLKGISKEP